jgi:hypothetical protein
MSRAVGRVCDRDFGLLEDGLVVAGPFRDHRGKALPGQGPDVPFILLGRKLSQLIDLVQGYERHQRGRGQDGTQQDQGKPGGKAG